MISPVNTVNFGSFDKSAENAVLVQQETLNANAAVNGPEVSFSDSTCSCACSGPAC